MKTFLSQIKSNYTNLTCMKHIQYKPLSFNQRMNICANNKSYCNEYESNTKDNKVNSCLGYFSKKKKTIILSRFSFTFS